MHRSKKKSKKNSHIDQINLISIQFSNEQRAIKDHNKNHLYNYDEWKQEEKKTENKM